MDLDKLRDEIDDIDKEIVRLINERTERVLSVGEYKKKEGIKVYSPEREKLIQKKIQDLNEGQFPNKALISIYREIISASRNLEEKQKVAYLGPEATYSHAACLEFFGSSTDNIPLPRISDVFLEVEREKVDYGIVPVENSYEGLVTYTLDMFLDSPLKICSETLYRVRHCLLGNIDNLSQIKKLYAHPQALAQCRLWIESNLPHVERVETSSTSKGASIAAWDKYSAAIGSEAAALIHDLYVIAKNIEDVPENYTRFLIIGKQDCKPTGNDKTSILCKIQDKPGALLGILKPFADRSINLTKIESRPSKRKVWDYVFFIDIDGHIQDVTITQAIKDVEQFCTEVKILGSYPKYEEIKDNTPPLNTIINLGR